ncbi:hypothetical protein HYW46_04050 [Candidatus Daviesbacteria bacterium]|nr:hypothetical protein [Candidatus Daviesbacteria bacterium]
MTQEQENVAEVQPEVRKKILVKVNFFEDELEDLKRLAEARGTNMTEALRGAIATEKFLREKIAEGNSILIQNKEVGTIREVLLIPKKEQT